jgi:hypothetical protein
MRPGLQLLEKELPETAAAMRLSGLELSDCIAEVGALSADLTSGVRSGARLLSSTETGIKAGGAALGRTVNERVVPALASTESSARGERGRVNTHLGTGHSRPHRCMCCVLC